MPTAIARPPPSAMTSLCVLDGARTRRLRLPYEERPAHAVGSVVPCVLRRRRAALREDEVPAVQQEEHSHPPETVSLSRSASQATTHFVTGGAIGESARRGDRYRARLGQYRIDRDRDRSCLLLRLFAHAR